MPRYHWILTLQTSGIHGGTGIASGAGTITPATGQTRASVFEQARQHVCEQAGIAPARTNIVFFSLELDELS